jgi:hypothetical protein
VSDDRNGPNDEQDIQRQGEREPSLVGRPAAEDAATSGDLTDDLERQARETLRTIQESAGALGSRVRQVLERASAYWEEATPGLPALGQVSAEDERRARALARRWEERDFLVDPELHQAMTVVAVREIPVWQVELRERGETRTTAEGTEAYRGQQPPALGPVLPVWDYFFPVSPEIEAGERRERLSGTEVVGACLTCNGTGHRPCQACDGHGFTQCPNCHGRARIPCRRCRGRGRIADAKAERDARSAKGYWQVRAERLAVDAGERLADFAERLRQEYGVPLPPSAEWAPMAPASGQTVPCPDCVNGSVPCVCGNGKRVCDVCHGTSAAPCSACGGTGKVVRFRELVRRFDTRIHARSLFPSGDEGEAITDEMLRRAPGELAWEGTLDELGGSAPGAVPADVWQAAQRHGRDVGREMSADSAATGVPGAGERRVISTRLLLTRVPVTVVSYTFADAPYTFTAVGRAGAERFWAQGFPPRWSRVGRFFKALTRDLQSEGGLAARMVGDRKVGELSDLEAFRSRRALNPEGANGNGRNDAKNGSTAARLTELSDDAALQGDDTRE